MKRLAVLFLVLAGCGDERRPSAFRKTRMPLDEVPENIRKIAQDDLKESTIHEAFRKTTSAGEFVSYELRGKNPKTGKLNEVGVAPDGTILERE